MNDVRPLILVGAGGHGRSCLAAAHGTGLRVAGLLDPDLQATLPGVPRLGGDEWLERPEAGDYQYLISVGQIRSATTRIRIYQTLRQRNLPLATLRAGSAVIATDARIGAGSAVMALALVNANAQIGDNCIINSAALIEHDACIGAHTHVSTGAIVNGDARIGERCFIGSRAVVLQGVHIAHDVVIGAGAVVTQDIDTPGTWLGLPARSKL